MEIQIDTSIITKTSTKIEELITQETESIFHKENKPSEVISLSVECFLVEKTVQRSMVLCGKVKNNNQTLYELNINDTIFVLIVNDIPIDLFLNNVRKAMANTLQDVVKVDFDIKTDEAFVYKANVNFNTNERLIPLLFLSTCMKMFFSFLLKFKYNKWDSILINTRTYTESYLIAHVLRVYGYEVTVNTSNFDLKDKSLLEDERGIFITVNLNTVECLASFLHVIDTTGDMLKGKDKINTLLLIKQNGSFHQIEACNETQYQLIPTDFDILFEKNITLSFTSIEQCIKFNYTVGREINFHNEVLSKLTESLGAEIKTLLEKLECKITQLGGKDPLELSLENNKLINLFILS